MTRSSQPMAFLQSRRALLCVVLLVVGVGAALPLVQAQALVGLTSSLTTQQTPITPTFDSYTTDYEQTVSSFDTAISVRPVLNATAAAAGARIFASWQNGDEIELQNAQDSPAFTLDPVVSLNFLLLVVRQTDVSPVEYSLRVTRPLIVSKNSNLLQFVFLTQTGATPATPTDLVTSINPSTFSSKTYGYAVQLAPGVGNFRFAATVDSKASLRYKTTRSVLSPAASFDPTPEQGLNSGTQSGNINLVPGQRQRIDVRVVAEDGRTATNYAYLVGSNGDAMPDPPTVLQFEEVNNSTAPSSSAGSESTSTAPNQEGNELGAASTAAGLSDVGIVLLAFVALVAARR